MNSESRRHRDYQARINRTLVYIQNNLDEDITLDDLAKVSHFSRYHFHRIFSAYTGESAHAYVRRLRLQKAARQLVYADEDITSIALTAGFETAAAFSRAFKQVMGITPRELRLKGSLGEYCNPFRVTINFSGETIMQPISIKNIPEQKVIFVRRTGSYFDAAPAAWQAMKEYISTKQFSESVLEMLGIAHDDPAVTVEEHLRYDACIAGLDHPVADGEIGVQTIAGGKYVIFEHVGPYEKLGDTFRQIYGQWYPASNVALRDLPEFIHYVERHFNQGDYKTMPAERKAKLVTHVYLPIE